MSALDLGVFQRWTNELVGEVSQLRAERDYFKGKLQLAEQRLHEARIEIERLEDLTRR